MAMRRLLGPGVMAVFLGVSAAAAEDSRAEEVIRLVRKSSSHSPRQYMTAMRRLSTLGAAAVAPLADSVTAEREDLRINFACDALERLHDGTDGPRVSIAAATTALRGRLDSANWMIRDSCLRAFGGALADQAAADRDAADVAKLRSISRTDATCAVREYAASGLGEMDDSEERKHWEAALAGADDCARRVALEGLTAAPTRSSALGPALVTILSDPRSADDLLQAAALSVETIAHTPARPAILELIKKRQPAPNNLRSFCIEALGAIGLPEDVALLREVIAKDPYKGEGVWAVTARQSIKAIEKRNGG